MDQLPDAQSDWRPNFSDYTASADDNAKVKSGNASGRTVSPLCVKPFRSNRPDFTPAPSTEQKDRRDIRAMAASFDENCREASDCEPRPHFSVVHQNSSTPLTARDPKASASQANSLQMFSQRVKESIPRTLLEAGNQKKNEKLLLMMSRKKLDDREEVLCKPSGDRRIDEALVQLWNDTGKRERAEKLQRNMIESISRQ